MSRVLSKTADRSDLPRGDVTFLFTDLEGSSAAWERRPEAARIAMGYHDRVASELTQQNGGVVIKHTGDGVKSVFTSPADGLAAAVAMQESFQRQQWDGVDRMQVRIGLHGGVSTPEGDDYYGGVINRAARVTDIANGDQIAITNAVRNGIDVESLDGLAFVDHGHIQLKGCGKEQVYLVEADSLVVDGRPLRIRTALAGSALPPEGSRLVGREIEIEGVGAFLSRRRLTSIVGLGGCGKTRLAITVARRNAGEFTDGVVFCPLAPISAGGADPEASVMSALAEALGARLQPDADMLSSIVQFIEGRDVLLVLDNCEHVKPSVRAIVERLLAVDGPTVLVTSREPLEVAGEQRVNLEPLDVGSDAVDLLVERALERDPFFVREQHEPILREICTHLDGIPLALELAAARLRILAPEQLLDGLKQGLAVLEGGKSSTPTGLGSALIWSFEQLDERQKSILEGLSVFSGSFSLEAAAAVLSIDDDAGLLDDVSQLVELSLVKTQPGQGGIRFSLLETIRQFARTQLSSRSYELGDKIRDAHALYFATLAFDCGHNLMTASEGEVWTRIDSSIDDIRVALNHLVLRKDFETAAQIVIDLAWFSVFSMRMELFTWARNLLEEDELENSADLWAVRSIGDYLNADNSCYRSALRSLELDPSDPTGLAQTTLASIAVNNTLDFELAISATEHMLDNPSDRFPEKRIVGLGLRSFALCLREPNPEATAMAEQTLREAKALGSASALTFGHWARLISNMVIARPTANDAIEQGLAMAESLSTNHLISHLIRGVSVHFASLAGPVHEAAAVTAKEIRATMDRHYLVGASHLLGAAAVTLCRAGRADDGAALLRAMVDNGHRPRREIRKTVEASLDGESIAPDESNGWSINETGHRAILWLDEVAAAAMDNATASMNNTSASMNNTSASMNKDRTDA